jgi:hypothetical protein
MSLYYFSISSSDLYAGHPLFEFILLGAPMGDPNQNIISSIIDAAHDQKMTSSPIQKNINVFCDFKPIRSASPINGRWIVALILCNNRTCTPAPIYCRKDAL